MRGILNNVPSIYAAYILQTLFLNCHQLNHILQFVPQISIIRIALQYAFQSQIHHIIKDTKNVLTKITKSDNFRQ